MSCKTVGGSRPVRFWAFLLLKGIKMKKLSDKLREIAQTNKLPDVDKQILFEAANKIEELELDNKKLRSKIQISNTDQCYF